MRSKFSAHNVIHKGTCKGFYTYYFLLQLKVVQ